MLELFVVVNWAVLFFIITFNYCMEKTSSRLFFLNYFSSNSTNLKFKFMCYFFISAYGITELPSRAFWAIPLPFPWTPPWAPSCWPGWDSRKMYKVQNHTEKVLIIPHLSHLVILGTDWTGALGSQPQIRNRCATIICSFSQTPSVDSH